MLMGMKIEVFWSGSDAPWRIGHMHWILTTCRIDLFVWPISIMLTRKLT